MIFPRSRVHRLRSPLAWFSRSQCHLPISTVRSLILYLPAIRHRDGVMMAIAAAGNDSPSLFPCWHHASVDRAFRTVVLAYMGTCCSFRVRHIGAKARRSPHKISYHGPRPRFFLLWSWIRAVDDSSGRPDSKPPGSRSVSA